ncbi:membrane protein [Dyella jiangningensis]|nr:membrane protein [Dyella jiangningensis]AHX13421.1 membrane protein [Dyella jiangningensis]
MKTLIAVIYKHQPEAAAQTLARLQDMEREYLIELQDTVIVRRNDKGKLFLQQSVNLAAAGAWSGAFWGTFIGLIFAGLPGMVIAGLAGAGMGALSGRLSDYGIDDNFVRELSSEVEPCCSALFVLADTMTTDRVIQELQGTGGRILRTSLPADVEARLQQSIAAHPAT